MFHLANVVKNIFREPVNFCCFQVFIEGHLLNSKIKKMTRTTSTVLTKEIYISRYFLVREICAVSRTIKYLSLMCRCVGILNLPNFSSVGPQILMPAVRAPPDSLINFFQPIRGVPVRLVTVPVQYVHKTGQNICFSIKTDIFLFSSRYHAIR